MDRRLYVKVKQVTNCDECPAGTWKYYIWKRDYSTWICYITKQELDSYPNDENRFRPQDGYLSDCPLESIK